MIKKLIVNGETLVNVPCDKSVLIELGLTAEQAEKAISDNQRETLLERIRLERKPLIKEADELVNKALDNGIDDKPFRQYRQALRDVTKLVDGVLVWPTAPAVAL